MFHCFVSLNFVLKSTEPIFHKQKDGKKAFEICFPAVLRSVDLFSCFWAMQPFQRFVFLHFRHSKTVFVLCNLLWIFPLHGLTCLCNTQVCCLRFGFLPYLNPLVVISTKQWLALLIPALYRSPEQNTMTLLALYMPCF